MIPGLKRTSSTAMAIPRAGSAIAKMLPMSENAARMSLMTMFPEGELLYSVPCLFFDARLIPMTARSYRAGQRSWRRGPT